MIRLQFSTQGDVVSSMIRLATHGWTTHVDIVLPTGDLLGARLAGGVAIRPPDYAVFVRKLIVNLPCQPDVEDRFYDFAKAQVGKPYDLTADVAFALDRNWREDDSWMCSELASAALETSGYLAHRLCAPTNRISPAALMLILSAIVDIPDK